MADKIINSYDVWITAQGLKSKGRLRNIDNISLEGIARLRELILELAIRGKLTPQDPNDEPAITLLKNMSKEEEKLAREKVIKKPRDLPPISNNEFLFELPKGWAFTRLNNVGEWGAGATPLRSKHEYYGGNIPWFKSGELSSDFISQSEETVTELALKETSLRYNKIGDVLIAMYGATIGKASILKVPATTNQAVCACTPFAGIYNIFLLLLLKAYNKRFNNMGAGGAQPNISREKIIATVIPLPPMNEQHRIVAKVDELMALCDELEKQETHHLKSHQLLVETLLGTLTRAKDAAEFQTAWSRLAQHFDDIFTTEDSIDQLKQTILQLAVMGKLVPQDPNDEPASELLKRIDEHKKGLVKKIGKGKPLPSVGSEKKENRLPEGWAWCRLGDITTLMDSGWSPACSDRPAAISTWGVLKTTAVQKMQYIEAENKELPAKLTPKAQYEVKPGDILITRAGPRNRVGICCQVKSTRTKLMISDKIIRFHLYQDLNPEFVTLLLNTGVSHGFIESKKSGMADSQLNISQENLKDTPLPIPPFNEQAKIISRVHECFAACDQLKERIANAQKVANQVSDSILEQVL